MRTFTDTDPEATPARLLADHHRELDRQFETLVTRAREGDSSDLRCEWTAFERELLRHLELEEAEILPAFAQHDSAGAQAILADHAEIRSELLEIGVNLDLHLLRTETVDSFVRRLRDHARREEAALYEWAGRHVTPARWSAMRRELGDASARWATSGAEIQSSNDRKA